MQSRQGRSKDFIGGMAENCDTENCENVIFINHKLLISSNDNDSLILFRILFYVRINCTVRACRAMANYFAIMQIMRGEVNFR